MILIVDDDPSVITSLSLLLRQHGYEVASANGPAEAAEHLTRRAFDLVLQDMNFSRDTSGREGLELLRRTKELRPKQPVILITAWGSIALAVEGVKAGASDFLTKPWSNDHLVRSVETVLALSRESVGAVGVPQARSEIDAKYDFGCLIGEAPEFLRVLELTGRVSPTDATLLITGESGTGKELIAEAVHRNSRRRDGPFVKVNLGGISSTLFESEMFGHVRGAFTDARSDRKGRFEVADSGTIFLDEVGELDLSSQVKLLRVLQDRTYESLGSSGTRRVDVRIVSATNRDLTTAVERGDFREDLFYRLNLITVRVPPIRERPSDIRRLADYFLDRFASQYQRSGMRLSDDAVAWLERRPWPGNVRQLKQTVERAILVVARPGIEVADLETLARLESGERAEVSLPHPGSMTLDEMERAMISNCMRHYDGNVTHAAEALGLSRAALYRRLEKYGLDENG